MGRDMVGVGEGVRNCVGRQEKMCGRVYGVSGEVCRRVGKGYGEKNRGDVWKCVRVWGLNTLPPTFPYISSLTSFPHLSLHLPLLPSHPNTLSYTSSHTSSLSFLCCRYYVVFCLNCIFVIYVAVKQLKVG